MKNRTNAVLNSIYLLFNAGYNSSVADQLIRKDLMAEAMMLGKLLAENRHTKLPEVFALMALMCFHAARIESRLTPEGEIVLLSYQDRRKWDYDLIHLGNCYLSDAAFGDEISPYHIEAAIAFEHCAAKVFDQTNWKKILELYEWLSKISPSPVTDLNRAVAIMQVYGSAKALEYLQSMPDLKKLESFYLYHSLVGEIFTRLHNYDKAKASLETALDLTSSETEKKILNSRLSLLRNSDAGGWV
ncbi:MAG: hypothetical protein JST75_21255 [Bacteroidetes bacterium]|nr:hypothetical protein [Bacteroidota bacterium]